MLAGIVVTTVVIIAVFVLYFILAIILVWAVAILADKDVPSPMETATVYALASMLGLALKPLFLELATGKHFGSVPGQWESRIYHVLSITFICAPHAVFFAWGARVLEWAPRFPDWRWIVAALVAITGITYGRIRARSRRPVRNHTFPDAVTLLPGDPAHTFVSAHVKKGELIEAVKHLRCERGLNLHQAVHTVRKIRFETLSPASPKADNQDLDRQ